MTRRKPNENAPEEGIRLEPFEPLDLLGEPIDLMPDPAFQAGARAHRREGKKRIENTLKLERFADQIPPLPDPGWTYHVLVDGSFDFWTWVPGIVHELGTAEQFYGATWAMNGRNVQELLSLMDAGKLKEVAMITGRFFKRVRIAAYIHMVEGLKKRGGRYVIFRNHAKIILIHKRPHWITVEGSANFTDNPRLEQYTVTNDWGLYAFHRKWMEGALRRYASQDGT